MQALVTGGNGFIGSFLIEALLAQGHTVRCLIRKTSNLRWIEKLPIEFVYGDVNAPETLTAPVQGCDWVVHLGGVTRARDEAGYLSVNATGTQNLLRACSRENPQLKKFVLVSSLAAVGPTIYFLPATEDWDPAPISPYGRSKAAAEKITLSFRRKLPVTIVRPPAVYGPRDVDVFEIFKYVKWGIKPRIAGFKRLTSIIYVQDLVDGIILAAEKPEATGQTYFLSGDGFFGWEDIANAVEWALGKRAVSLPVPLGLMRGMAIFSEFFARFSRRPALLNREKIREMEQVAWICDNQKAKTELGFQPKFSLERGCLITANWYRAQGWL
jgi:nucleoside-diphosphate-sugar epimerase